MEQITLEEVNQLINKVFARCPFIDRTKLFKDLENWANTTLRGEVKEIFLESLYSSPSTQDAQVAILVKESIDEVTKKKVL